ncbi:MAG: hypothetical protein ACI9P5_004614 [Saprospiraceae bacterium]|jgi:hypothetical protein
MTYNGSQGMFSLARLFLLSMWLFLAFSILDPVGSVFRLKAVFFFTSCAISGAFYIACMRAKINRNLLISLFVIVFIVPFLSYIVVYLCDVSDVDPLIRTQYLVAFIPLVLLLPVVTFHLPVQRLVVAPLLLLCVLIFLVFTSSVLNLDFGHGLAKFLDQKISAAKIGIRDFNGFLVYMVYYKTSVLLVFLMAYFASSRSFFSLLVCFLITIIMVISATRANAIIGIGILGSYVFFYLRDRNLVLSYLYFFSCVVIAIFAVYFGHKYFFSSDEISNQIKIGHINGYVEYFKSAGGSIIYGAGAGSGFYTPGYHKIIYSSELSYLEIYRVYGLLALPFLGLLLFPIFKYKRLGREFTIAWLSYLLIAGTNPLLVSSTGMVAILIIYGKLMDRYRGTY